MRSWVRARLKPVAEGSAPVRVVLDPDRILTAADLTDLGKFGELVTVADWLDLRRTYEASGRRRPVDDSPLLLVVQADEFTDPRTLPYDIEQRADVATVRLPLSEPLRSLVLALPDDLQDLALDAASGPDPLGAILDAVWNVRLPQAGASEVAELEAVIRLRTDPTIPGELWPLVHDRLRTPLARAMAADPPDTSTLQAAWEEWVADGPASRWDVLFQRLGSGVAVLFHTGLLTPVATTRTLPGWAEAGIIQPGWPELAESLLLQPPFEGGTGHLAEWVRLAEWWGELRMAIALGSPETEAIADRAWTRWAEWDRAFREYLHDSLGKLLTSASRRPQTLNRIAAYLARRLREGRADRLMLVVFDGMGFAQWSLVRREARLKVLDVSGVLAMAPTLTPISRQAIFAGELPNTFPDHLGDTKMEREMWLRFWESEGVPVTGVGYINLEGTGAFEVPHFPTENVVGVVVRAIDELMHTSELLGEAQFAANVRTWLRHGFVRELVERATADGFEVWFTADHGSLEVVPLGRPMEGLAVDTAGTRVRLYSTRALREQSKAEGDPWDPPGMPEEGPCPLFAWGRDGFRHDVRVTHGGLSLDEMVVPFVRVEP